MKFDSDSYQNNGSGFGFSAVRPETLGSTEYTLVTVVVDKTGSVTPFAPELLKLKQAIVQACRKSPRADFLLLRLVEFNSRIDEVHGFQPLSALDPSAYALPNCGGLTALYDATFAAVSATNAYARTLTDQDYLVNAITFIITDGDDNNSRMGVADVKREMDAALRGEHLESMRTVLVGVNAADYRAELERFKTAVGIDQFEEVENASAQSLAKLADFVSRSISAQSQSLGTGGPSQALNF